jgi:general secretion pathway protein D
LLFGLTSCSNDVVAYSADVILIYGQSCVATQYLCVGSNELVEVEVETSDNSNPVFTITTPTPTFADAENIGTDLTVTAKINKGRIINLSLHPKFTAFIGEESYYMKLHQMVRNNQGGWSDNVAVFRIWKPIITTRELDINIDVRDGETVVIGALSDSNISSRRDKIPILGDLPLIGRFFQSTSERAIHKSMLFFVTARLIDDRGVPVHHVDGSGGIPDLRQ